MKLTTPVWSANSVLLASTLAFAAGCKSLPPKQFSSEGLSAKQAAAGAAFKSKAGNDRRAEAEAIQGLDILPAAPVRKTDEHRMPIDISPPSFLMTREEVVSLLGEPSEFDDRSIYYRLGDSSFRIQFRRGYVVAHGIFLTYQQRTRPSIRCSDRRSAPFAALSRSA